MKQHYLDEFVQTISKDQQSDGSFLSYSVPLGQDFGPDAQVYQTTFMTALVTEALAEVKDERLEEVRRRAAEWLLAQRGPQWSFNYWARQAPEAASKPYPDDWDDTSCTVAALTHVLPEAVTGEVLGHVVTLLTNTETAEGGPYRTWIVPEDAPEHWQDVDVAVNANIAYMLKLHEVELPSLEELVEARVQEGTLSSPYYPGPGPIEYFVARWYRGKLQGQLSEQILARRRDGRWGNALETALAVSASLNLGMAPREVAEAAEWLRGLGVDELRAEAFCLDPAIEGRAYVAGARALTAALGLEALANYDAAMKAKPARSAGESERMRERVVGQAMARFELAGDDIRAAAHQMKDRLLAGTAGSQITLLPYWFRRALGEPGQAIADERIVDLGVISFDGWLAYTIYDDFLDDEGEPPLLPAANVALRELVLTLAAETTRTAGFDRLVWPILDRQEAANAWEVRHCRVRRQAELTRVPVPDFGDRRALAERSMGHALGCLILAIEAGHKADSHEVRALQRFFHHFLIARQLSDDAHDWKADLHKGQINAVGALLLSQVDRRGVTVRELYARMEQYFWDQGITAINEWIFSELTQARAALKEAAMVQRPEVLEALLAPIDEAAQAATAQREQMVAFLRTYQAES